MLIILFTPQI